MRYERIIFKCDKCHTEVSRKERYGFPTDWKYTVRNGEVVHYCKPCQVGENDMTPPGKQWRKK